MRIKWVNGDAARLFSSSALLKCSDDWISLYMNANTPIQYNAEDSNFLFQRCLVRDVRIRADINELLEHPYLSKHSSLLWFPSSWNILIWVSIPHYFVFDVSFVKRVVRLVLLHVLHHRIQVHVDNSLTSLPLLENFKTTRRIQWRVAWRNWPGYVRLFMRIRY